MLRVVIEADPKVWLSQLESAKSLMMVSWKPTPIEDEPYTLTPNPVTDEFNNDDELEGRVEDAEL